MEHLGAITVREAVEFIPGARVLAGTGGMERIVRSVGVLEAPDALRFVKPGDFLITALYAIRDDRAAQIDLVSQVNRLGAAGLAVKQSYVRELPSEMLLSATELALPLVVLPPDVPFSEVMQPIFAKIVSRQATVLSRQQETHREMMKAVLEGRGLESLALSLCRLLGNPVAILDTGRRVLAWAPGAVAGDEAEELERQSAREASQSEYLLSAGDTLHRHEVVRSQGRTLSRVVTPVVVGSHAHGEIVVWEVGRPVGDLDLITLDSAATVVALEFTNRRTLLEVERRYRSEFLAALFAPEIRSEAALMQRARLYGLDLAAPHYVVALKAEPASVHSPQEAAAAQAAADQLYETVCRLAGAEALTGEVELHTVVLRRPGGKGDGRAEAMGFAQHLLEQVRPFGRLLRLSIGVGSVQRGVEGVRRSFREARRAATIAERVWGPGRVAHVDDLGVFPILDMIGPSDEIERFLAGIRRLVEYDQAHRTDLVRTLEAFFANKGNVRRVAAQLYAHYNTVLYRLERIQQITGMDLEDAESRLHLQLALHAARLRGLVPSPAVGSLA